MYQRQGSRTHSVSILFFERYVRTLTYAVLSYVNKNRVRAWQCIAIGNAFVLQTDSVRRQVKEQKKLKQYFELKQPTFNMSLATETGSLLLFLNQITYSCTAVNG